MSRRNHDDAGSSSSSSSSFTVSLSLFCVSAYYYYYYYYFGRGNRRIRNQDDDWGGGGGGRGGYDRSSRSSSRHRPRRTRRRRRTRTRSPATNDRRDRLPQSHYASRYSSSEYDEDEDDDDDYCDSQVDGDDIHRGFGGGGGAPALGSRGCQALDQPAVPYMDQFLECLENLCDPQFNPAGCIPLCVAENRLVLDLLSHKFVHMTAGANAAAATAATATTQNGSGGPAANGTVLRSTTATGPFADPRTYCYNSFLGMPVARDAAAYFIARHLLFGGDYTGDEGTATRDEDNGQRSAAWVDGTTDQEPPARRVVDVSPERALEAVPSRNVVLGTGAAALLSHLLVLLSNSNGGNASQRECCLIPAPYYAAFDNHCRLLADVEPVGISQENPAVGPSDPELEVAYRQAQQQGLVPRFLLVTNPNNPLGVVYAPETIQRLVQWSRNRDMHTIVDEVYALSTHPSHTSKFQSVIKVLDNQLGHDVHLLYALSKDFGASGLRVGMLYTHNDALLDALPSLNIYTCVPGPVQYLVAELLTDDDFVDNFLETSRHRLAYSYHICAQKLDEMVIPHVPAHAGVFVYADFSTLIPSRLHKSDASRRQWETDFGALVFRYARLVMTPGTVQHDPRPGMFRICYGWVPVEVLQIAMERLSRLVAKVRRLDWDDLNDRTLSGVLDVGVY